jgi:DNA-binding response OmpR family regulator
MKSAPRVLVLEDEPLIAIMLVEWLQELGCEVVGPARNVTRALELVGAGGLDAAILDVSIGNEDCAPVADLLQERGVPIAFATGRAPESVSKRHAGALWLAKPYEFQAVRDVLHRLLGERPGIAASSGKS